MDGIYKPITKIKKC